MGLGLVLVGIAIGLITAVGVLVLGGGFWLTMLAYLGGGLAGMLGGLAHALLPRHHVGTVLSQDQG
jgi:hypothetical protein